MGVSQMLADLKAHLEHGAELVASHVPVLVDWAQKAESDPLVQAAIDLAVPPETRAMLAQMLKTFEAEVQRVEAATTAQAQAAGTPPEAPAPA